MTSTFIPLVFLWLSVLGASLSDSLAASICPGPIDLAELGVAGEIVPLEVDKPEKGVFLAASRMMADPRFWHSIIFLLEHDEQGTMGLIINRPTTLRLADALPGLTHEDGGEHPLFFGGPVATEHLFLLMRSEIPLPQADQIIGDVYASADRSVLERLLSLDKTTDELRLYFGYAGWVSGQLDAEIMEGAWHLFRVDSAAAVFHDAPDTLWGRFIEHQRSRQIMAWNPSSL